MAITLSKEQIEAERKLFFEDIFLKNIILKKSGEGFSINTEFYIQDGLDEEAKFFKTNDPNKLIVKCILITNPELRNELNSASNIVQIDSIIQKYKAPYKNIYPSMDYYGDRNSVMSHSNGVGVSLKYIVNMEVNEFIDKEKETTIKDFCSIAFIMHRDYMEYSKQLKLSLSDMNLEVLSNKIQIFDLFSSGRNLTSYLQDTTLLNNIFKNAEKLNTALNDIYLNSNKVEIPKKANITTETKYISAPLFSKNLKDYLCVIFNADLSKFVKDSVNFFSFQNTEIPQALLDNLRVKHIKILRRGYSRNISERDRIRYTNQETIAQASENIEGQFVGTNNNIAIIKEIKLSDKYRTFQIVDKQALKTPNTCFEYGIEITIPNICFSFAKGLYDTLIGGSKFFNEYLNETNNSQHYDRNNSYFTQNFVFDIYPDKYEKQLKKYIEDYVDVLETIKIVDPKNSSDLKGEILESLDASLSNFSSITSFIKQYERTILILDKYLKTNSDADIVYQTWLKSEYPKDDNLYNNGYDFLPHPTSKTKEDILEIPSSYLESLFSEELIKFSTTAGIENFRSTTAPYSITPKFAKFGNKTVDLSTLENDSKYTHLDLEKEIKDFIKPKQSVSLSFEDKIMSLLMNRKDSLTTFRVNENITPEVSKYFPEQNLSLIKKKSNIFPGLAVSVVPDFNASLTKSNNISKFIINYNLVHIVEYKKIDSDLHDSKWEILTQPVLSSIDIGKSILCRLKLFSNAQYGISFSEEIKLPIYNNIFVLSKDTAGTSFSERRVSNQLPTFGEPYRDNQFGRIPSIFLKEKIILKIPVTNLNNKLKDVKFTFSDNSIGIADKQLITPNLIAITITATPVKSLIGLKDLTIKYDAPRVGATVLEDISLAETRSWSVTKKECLVLTFLEKVEETPPKQENPVKPASPQILSPFGSMAEVSAGGAKTKAELDIIEAKMKIWGQIDAIEEWYKKNEKRSIVMYNSDGTYQKSVSYSQVLEKRKTATRSIKSSNPFFPNEYKWFVIQVFNEILEGKIPGEHNLYIPKPYLDYAISILNLKKTTVKILKSFKSKQAKTEDKSVYTPPERASKEEISYYNSLRSQKKMRI